MLKLALTITVATVGGMNGHDLARADFNSLDLSQHIFYFCSVSSNVLYSRSPTLAWNETEILQPMIAMPHRIVDDIIEGCARPAFQAWLIASLLQDNRDIETLRRCDDLSAEILCEQKIASSSQQQERSLQVFGYKNGIVLVFIDNILVTLLIDIECVVVQQRMVLLYLHSQENYALNLISFQCFPIFRKYISISKELEIPRMTKSFRFDSV